MSIRSITKEDWSQVRDIYQKGIETKVATFETSPPEHYDEWSKNWIKTMCLFMNLKEK